MSTVLISSFDARRYNGQGKSEGSIQRFAIDHGLDTVARVVFDEDGIAAPSDFF